jgi:hypothetical protein
MGFYFLRRLLLSLPVVLGVAMIRSRGTALAQSGGREPLLPPEPPNGFTF